MKRLLVIFGLLLFIGTSLYGQAIRITGTVTSADGTTIPGASVMVEGTTLGTVTDINGDYDIQAAPDATLVFSFIGYSSQRVPVDGRETINVSLEEETVQIEGVVVTALGISRERRALSYSVQGVSGDELTEGANETNMVNSLAGRVAGVQVTNSSGGIGSSARITLRGNSSFGNNQPLFVVDGTPVSNFATAVSQYGGADYGNAMMDIDPANIADISVLKGGMAAALYGQNASNGVILITTKDGSGKGAPFGVNISSTVTFDNPYIFPDYQNEYGQGFNGSEYIYKNFLANNELSEAEYSYQQFAFDYGFHYADGNWGGVNDGMDESWGPRLDIGLSLPQFNSPYTYDASGTPIFESTPWVSSPNNVENFFQTGMSYDNSFEVYGSGESTTARLGISSMNVSGAIPNTDLSRYSVAFSGDVDFTDRFTAEATVNYVKNTSDNLPAGGYDGTNIMQSIGGWFGRQVNMEDLEANWDKRDAYGRYYNWNHSYHNNPYFTMNRMLNARERDRVFGNILMTYRLTDWLNLSGRVGNDYLGENRKEVWDSEAIGVGVTQGGRFNTSERVNNEFNADVYLNFDSPLSEDIRIDGLLGGNYFHRTYRMQYIQADELTVPDLFTIGNVSGSPINAMNNSEQVSNSVFGALNISFWNYLFLNATARNDWSSTLPEDAWSYFYPSVGLGLIFTDALGLESDVLSYGKIRGSWAQIGKGTGPYQTVGTYSSNQPFKGVTQFFIDRTLPPIGLKNETTTSYEVGLELAFLMNRVSLDVTYFNNISRDQILAVEISPAAGYNSMRINAGEIQNKGIELLLRGGILDNPAGLNWDITFNWSVIDNTVNELYGDLEALTIGSSWGGLTIEARPGRPYGEIMAVDFARDEQGRVIVHPTSGRVIKTPVPVNVGNVMPDWIGGVRNSLSWGPVNLSFLIDAQIGGDLFSVTHWFGGYAGIAGFTTEGGIRENGVIVGQDVLADVGAVTAATNPDGSVMLDDDGFPVGSGSPSTISISAQTYFGDYWGNQGASIIDASFVKLREVTLGFNLPRSIVSRMGFIRGAQLSLVGRNLALLYTHDSNNINIDPETGFGVGNAGMGLEQFQLPSTRSIGFKINLNF
ncbi:MAG: SusC/RagA family TonB-linked outer membrane protein [Bacteroidales bacterium]